ncbi:hypothetical protein [Enterobacter kobei]|uniref:hypothetical protein n=1 Tax=Enterobacter kobei TaxID=208224 RepID=UPI00207641DE|nr:hypothetical protein [Enterobacter kobei]MCM7577586.1 hypothetical protein [Enterobacter kobei]
MSTITKEFTKEQLQQIIETDHVQCGEASALARIALASLEAEPVAWLLSGGGAKNNVSFDSGNAYTDPLREVTPLYTAPPAPANAEPVAWLWSHRKHPSEVSLIRPEDDERAEGAHWSGWSCQALYAAPPAPVSVPDEVCWEDVPEEITEDDMALASAWAHGFNQCRAAMLKHSEPFIVTSDHRMMEMPQVEAINAVTAMLQGVEPVTTAYKLRDAVEIIRNSGIEIDAEKIFAERDALNTPDCWCRTCRPVTVTDMRFVVCPDCGNKRCPHANDHRNACTGSNEPGQDGSAYPAAPQQEVK